ncbi:hypothetical protein SDC9_113257 [bioreactor metagenome]|uniref:Uncharacterized protein n=1 Tax=bioreactor metagenome TaxID=1076179 RepID=A0A645BLJ2_9ZZZZ
MLLDVDVSAFQRHGAVDRAIRIDHRDEGERLRLGADIRRACYDYAAKAVCIAAQNRSRARADIVHGDIAGRVRGGVGEAHGLNLRVARAAIHIQHEVVLASEVHAAVAERIHLAAHVRALRKSRGRRVAITRVVGGVEVADVDIERFRACANGTAHGGDASRTVRLDVPPVPVPFIRRQRAENAARRGEGHIAPRVDFADVQIARPFADVYAAYLGARVQVGAGRPVVHTQPVVANRNFQREQIGQIADVQKVVPVAPRAVRDLERGTEVFERQAGVPLCAGGNQKRDVRRRWLRLPCQQQIAQRIEQFFKPLAKRCAKRGLAHRLVRVLILIEFLVGVDDLHRRITALLD